MVDLTTLTPAEKDNMLHALGISHARLPGTSLGWRNYFYSPDDPELEAMADRGLMVRMSPAGYYAVPEEWRAPLIQEWRASLGKPFTCGINGDNHGSTFYAATRSKARYLAFLSFGDCLDNLKITDIWVRA